MIINKTNELFYDILANDKKYFPTIDKKIKAFQVSKTLWKDDDRKVMKEKFSQMTGGKIFLL